MGTYQQKPRWTERQTHFLLTNYDKMTDEQIADALGRTLKSVRRKRENMGLRKEAGRGVCAAYDPKKDKDGD